MKFITWIIILLGVGFAGYIFTQSQKPSISEKKKQQDIEKPALIRGMNLYEYRQNKLAWKFQIKSAELYEKKKLTYFTNISGRIYPDSAEQQPVKIKARKGVIDDNSQQMILKKNVRVSLKDGSQIDTEYLVIDLQNEKIFNQHKVVIKSQMGIIRGREIEYDIVAENLKLKQIDMKFTFK